MPSVPPSTPSVPVARVALESLPGARPLEGTGQGAVPAWLADESPFGMPWSEVVEHRGWYTFYPDAAPFDFASRLGFLALRRRPEQLPAVLSAPQGIAFDAPLFRTMDAGPASVLINMGDVEEEHVRSVVGELSSASAQQASTPDPAQLLTLLSPAADALRARMLLSASRLTQAHFGKRRRVYAPLYLSNACTNRCAYCGFSFGNDIERITLGVDAARREADVLRERGFDSVLVLTGEAPNIASVDYLERVIRTFADDFENIGLEVFPMSAREYGRMAQAGVDSVTIYQETYDPIVYRRVHEAGRKTDMLWRLQTPERVLTAGIRSLGMGALLGLSPWRFEALALGLHVAALRQRYPDARFSLSFPRLNPAEGAEAPPHPVEDAELIHMMAAFRLWLPDVELVLSTRESAKMRDRLAPLLATRLSAGSSTQPGGYASGEGEGALAQFSLADERTAEEVRDALCQRGLEPQG